MSELLFLKDIIKNMHLDIITCDYAEVTKTWGQKALVKDFSKLYFIEKGQGKIIIDGEVHYPKSGDLVLIPEGVSHSFESEPMDRYVKHYCHFNATVNGISLFELIDCVKHITDADGEKLRTSFIGCRKALESQSLTAVLSVKAHLLEILIQYISKAHVSEHTNQRDTVRKMKEITKYISEHLNGELNNKILASMAGLHPNYFSQLFRTTFGQTPVRYITLRRIEAAKTFLDGTNMPIQIIAEEVGFTNVYYFSNTFKRYVEMSPLAYRKR